MEQTFLATGGSTLRVIVLTALLVATLDATGAVVSFSLSGGGNPVRVFNYVASGIFGQQALAGGLPMAALGLLFHYLIATIWTFLFFKIGRIFFSLSRNWIFVGVLYGLIVWVGMNLIVVPLSNTPPSVFSIRRIVVGASVLVICIGLPISYRAKKYFLKNWS